MTAKPVFTGVNVVVADMDTTLAFYRLLGLDVEAVPISWPPGTGGRHATALSADGPRVEFDNTELARIWGHAGLAPGTPVMGFSFESRGQVDVTYDVAESTDANLVIETLIGPLWFRSSSPANRSTMTSPTVSQNSWREERPRPR